MRIGYACLTEGIGATNFKTCTLKNLNEENLLELIEHNLKSLENIIDYNIESNVKLFRISSDIIPFGSSSENSLEWWKLFQDQLEGLGEKIIKNEIRVSMHPGQYTVLNSLKKDVIERAVDDLIYHNRFLDSLKVDGTSKIILHIGGVYGDKENAIKRFVESYDKLEDGIKERLVIENDDKSYNINDVLEIGHISGIPVVYDNLHNEVLPFDSSKDDDYWIKKAGQTWKEEDGPQKIHYSQQDPEKRKGSHSRTVDLEDFANFVANIDYKDIDIMMEVKDKNLSAIKGINYFNNPKRIKNLEVEWSKYKYNILESSPRHYQEIRELLKDKKSYPILEFYKLIDRALDQEITLGNAINSAEHVWGYFKDKATEKELDKFEKYLERYKNGGLTIKAIKKLLGQMVVKYNKNYLLDSYYFYL